MRSASTVPRRLGSLSLPPTDLGSRELPIHRVGAVLFRLHRLNQEPAFWGRTGLNRFDAPAREFGVLYAAADQHGAFIETYGDVVDRTVTTTSLADRGWALVEPKRDLVLVDLSGEGLAQMSADERLCCCDHEVSQQWALALWRHAATVDGLHYRARHDPSRLSVALFDRAATAVSVVRHGQLLDERHQPALAEILDSYQVSLL